MLADKKCYAKLQKIISNDGTHSYQTLGNTFANGLEMSDNTYIGLQCKIQQILAVVDGWSIETALTTT